MTNAGPPEGASDARPRALIAGHGSFAVGVISAVEQVTGRGSAFIPMSNVGLSSADIEAAMAAALDESGARIIFTDLPAGSCTMAARRLQRARPGLVLVTGANLASLLDFVFHAETESPVDVAQQVVETGRNSIATFGG